MSSSSSSQPADETAVLVPATSPDRDQHFSDPSSGRVKYACASCIRGHRTSSCTHKDGSKGPLYPIRSKGRPPTQCEICRKKRKESGRHVRCDCTGKKVATPSSSTASTSASSASKPHKKATNVTTLAPILPRTAASTSSRASSDCVDSTRPAKKAKTHADTSKQAIHVASTRRISDAESMDDSLSDSSTYDNVLAPIRPPHAQHSWSLPSIHAAQSVARPADDNSSISQTVDPFVPRRYSTLSLSSLMNPCGCRSTGSCTCCSEQRQRKVPISPKQQTSNLEDCDPNRCSCSGPSCRQAKRVSPAPQRHSRPSVTASQSTPTASSCCSGKGPSASSAPSIELLLQAVDMSTEFVPPPCGCGENCRCARCLAKQGASAVHTHEVQRAPSTMTASSASPKTPPATVLGRPAPATTAASGAGCDDCAACDLALERPSGIGAVDSWMEKQRRPISPQRHRSSVESNQHNASSSATSANASRRASQAEVVPVLEHAGDRPIPAAVPTLHGGLLTSESSKEGRDQEAEEGVRAELVLVHPKCAACLKVVREKGVGVLSSANTTSAAK